MSPARASKYTKAEEGGTGLRLFLGLARQWRLDENEQRRLLGCSDQADLAIWRSSAVAGADVELPEPTLRRIRYLLSIFRALNTLYVRPDLAVRWLRQPNSDMYFGNRSPLEVMLHNGSAADLQRVRDYLDDMCTGMG